MNRRCFLVFLAGLGVTGCGGKRENPIPEDGNWIDLRGNWKWVSGGEIAEDDELRIGWGENLTAVRWVGEIPSAPFELELDAMRVDGTDFFCGVTFPVGSEEECVTLVVGGWGGSLVGISSVDGLDASENETKSVRRFETGNWYAIRIVCEGKRLRVWIDGEQVVDLESEGRKLGLRPGPISDCAPFGLATWQTTGKVKGARWRKLGSSR